MGKVKTKTLAERFGFRDEQLVTQGHDAIVKWTVDNIQEVFANHYDLPLSELSGCDIPLSEEQNYCIVSKLDKSLEDLSRWLDDMPVYVCPWRGCLKQVADALPSYVEHVKSKGLDLLVPRSYITTKWEPVVYNSRKYEVGFIDLSATIYHDFMVRVLYPEHYDWMSIREKSIRENKQFNSGVVLDIQACRSKTLYFEIKTKIPSYGELFRQLSLYMDNLNDPIYVVCPDDSGRSLIEVQGYHFLKSPAVREKEECVPVNNAKMAGVSPLF